MSDLKQRFEEARKNRESDAPRLDTEEVRSRANAAVEQDKRLVDQLGPDKAQFFLAVRRRGQLNAMLDGPALQYERLHPDRLTRWEYAPQDGDNSMVIAKEAMGFSLVDASELYDPEDESRPASAPTKGPVRCGDMVLMSGPRELVEFIHMEDARAAYEDWKLPETLYNESLAARTTVRSPSGQELHAVPFGKVTQQLEHLQGPVREPDREIVPG